MNSLMLIRAELILTNSFPGLIFSFRIYFCQYCINSRRAWRFEFEMNSRNVFIPRTQTSHGTEARQKRCFRPGFVYGLLALWLVGSIVALICTGVYVVQPYYQADKMTATECNTMTVTRGTGTLNCRCGRECMDTCRVNCTFVLVRYHTPDNSPSRIGKLSYGEHDLNEEVCKRDYCRHIDEWMLTLWGPHDPF